MFEEEEDTPRTPTATLDLEHIILRYSILWCVDNLLIGEELLAGPEE